MEYIMAMIDIGSIAQRINEIDNEIKKIEQKITQITETLKEQYFKASSAMTENQNYLLWYPNRSNNKELSTDIGNRQLSFKAFVCLYPIDQP